MYIQLALSCCLHTGLVIGHTGLLSGMMTVKAKYGVCILFGGYWGPAPRHRIMTSSLHILRGEDLCIHLIST